MEGGRDPYGGRHWRISTTELKILVAGIIAIVATLGAIFVNDTTTRSALIGLASGAIGFIFGQSTNGHNNRDYRGR